MDYSDELGTIEANLFYDNTRALVVVFLIFSFLFPLSYVVISYLRDTRESAHPKDDATVRRFVVGCCTSVLALNLTMVFMLPLSIVANEILVISPESYYVQWINKALLNTLFVSVTFGGKVACILLPFCFFLLSSHSVFRGKKAITSRFLDSSIYLSISYVAFFGSLVTIALTISIFSSSSPHEASNFFAEVLPQLSSNSFFSCYSWPIRFSGDFLCYFDAALVVVQQIISYFGLFILLLCMPYGIICTISLTLKISTHNSTSQPATSVEQYCMELIGEMYDAKLRTCSLYIENIHVPFPSMQFPLYDPISFKLCNKELSHPYITCHSPDIDSCHLTKQINRKNKDSTKETNMSRKAFITAAESSAILPFLILSFLFIILIVGAAYTATNILVILYGLIFSNLSQSLHSASTSSEYPSYEYLSDISIGHKSASHFGCIGALFQLLLVLFMICTSIFGFYSYPIVQKNLTPSPHETKLLKTVANCVCLLLLSSALPLQASLLGLANPPFPLYAVSLTDRFCKTAHYSCVSSSSQNPSTPGIFRSDFDTPLRKSTLESSYPIFDLISNPLSILTTAEPVSTETKRRSDCSDAHLSPEQQIVSHTSSEKRPNEDHLTECEISSKLSIVDVDNPTKNSPCFHVPTYILAIFYIGFHPRNCGPLMALAYNVGFLLTSYWLFKRHLHNFTHLLHLRKNLTLLFRWIPLLMRPKRPNSIISSQRSQLNLR